jgi:RNA polymerase sigma-70 factor (ECF subfamily)
MTNTSLIDLEKLYRSHFARVHVWVTRFGVPASESEDVVQEVFLQAHRGRTQFRGDSTPLHWLFRIAARLSTRRRNLCRALPAATPDDFLSELPCEGLSPYETAELEELVGTIERALDVIGARYRGVILANALGSVLESSTHAARASSASWVALHRARKKLRCSLEQCTNPQATP